MNKKNRSTALDYRKKDRKKVIKTVIQLVILFICSVILYKAFIDVKKYEEPDRSTWTNQEGFIAISYFGVDRLGTPKLIAKKELEKQLEALYDQGYRTISQQDIIDFYKKGSPLPDKALFLAFEDGRNDSSIFAHPLLKRYNYKATFLSYANKMGNSDQKFLQPKDMLSMVKGGYWELGSNGYRLTYINLFDDEGRSLGIRDENELGDKENIEYYNHYLMDFLRDENMIPIEEREEMETRIKEDYQLMNEIYKEQLGFVPNVYMIMHANTLYDGMNKLVSEANDEQIRKLFALHFNREGNAYNSQEEDLYDLTRLQPAPYWYTNHLLMRLKKDAGQSMAFIIGDEEQAAHWRRIGGAAEFIDNKIVLTSPPAGRGMLYLLESEEEPDVTLAATLSGNVIGRQSVYVRYNEETRSFVRVTLENNKIIITEKSPGQMEKEIGMYPLDEIVERPEDITFNKATVYTYEQTQAGARPEETEYPINIKRSRQLNVSIIGDELSVVVDQKPLALDLNIDPAITEGGVVLESAYHKSNRKDDVYDGVFSDLTVHAVDKETGEETLIYSDTTTKLQAIGKAIKKGFNGVVNWVIETF